MQDVTVELIPNTIGLGEVQCACMFATNSVAEGCFVSTKDSLNEELEKDNNGTFLERNDINNTAEGNVTIPVDVPVLYMYDVVSGTLYGVAISKSVYVTATSGMITL